MIDVEARILRGWQAAMPFADITADKHLEMIRERSKEMAFHEAGHGVAHAFIGHDFTHFKNLSIIPNKENMGRITCVRIYDFFMDMDVNEPDARPVVYAQAKGRIINSMAGPVAEALASKYPDEHFPVWHHWIESEAFWSGEDEAEWKDGSDIGRAWKYAKKIASPAWPVERWLSVFEGWTREMFSIPEVWECTEELAERLLQTSQVDNSFANITY